MQERQRRGEFLALMAAATATIAIAIDAMLPAFGDVRTHFGLSATASETALIITVFMGGLGIGQVVYGPLADRFGRKPIFMAGLLLYVVAGFATALAPSLELLIAGRFLWGIGAAGPRVVSQAMLRDRFRGDELARAMAVILTMFLIVPTVAPALGQAILALGSWRFTFAVGPVFATLVALWSTRVTESLDPSQRRPLDLRSIGRGVGEVLGTRSAAGNTVALTAMFAAFLPYLASGERMYGEIYDRGEQFFLWFAATSIVMAGFTLGISRVVDRRGTRRTTRGVLVLLVGVALVNVIGTVAAAGVPSFAFFFIATTLLVALNTALSPLLTSRALHDVGHVAGTAASTMGAISFVGSSLLSPIVDGAIATMITPFAVGYLIFALVAAVAAAWADRSERIREPAISG
ncbi:MAG TPA: MFS transporter [Acidimicrobiia bacterium]|jgi:DHA1 family bicyclomycin/chloramphenicol resistance-like MFS transporter|nr:MFS transporter [Acidimicrobiia bacterium]